MGIVFQKSAKLVRDARANRKRKATLPPTTKQKLMRRRQGQFNSIVEEARIWMYAMALPTEVIANGDSEVKARVDNAISELTRKLLGSKINPGKIDRVCGKIARNILIQGAARIEQGATDYPPILSEEQIRDMLDGRYCPDGLLRAIQKSLERSIHKDFRRLYPYARTWREVREALIEMELEFPPDGEVSIDRFDTHQKEYTLRELGLPWSYDMDPRQEQVLRSKSFSANPQKVWDLGFNPALVDLILVRDGGHHDDDIASVFQLYNHMSLHNMFYEYIDRKQVGLRDLPLIPGESSLSDRTCAVQIFLHEITHTWTVLKTVDHHFQYTPGDIDNLNLDDMILHKTNSDTRPDTQAPLPTTHESTPPTTPITTTILTYGLEACLALVRRDERDNTNKAEDSAENWAIYFHLRMLLLVYPEYDILAALHTSDPFNPHPDRTLHERHWNPNITDPDTSLLHHCTLFEPLRSHDNLRKLDTDIGPIRSHMMEYNILKDRWSGFCGHRPARTTKDTLEYLKTFDRQKAKRCERNRDKKFRQKRNRKARKQAEKARDKEQAEKEIDKKTEEEETLEEWIDGQDWTGMSWPGLGWPYKSKDREGGKMNMRITREAR